MLVGILASSSLGNMTACKSVIKAGKEKLELFKTFKVASFFD